MTVFGMVIFNSPVLWPLNNT